MKNIYDIVDAFIAKFELCMAIVNCKRNPKNPYDRYAILIKKDKSAVKLFCKEYKDYAIIIQPKDEKAPNIKPIQVYPREVNDNGNISYVFDCKRYNDSSSAIFSPYIIHVTRDGTLEFIHKKYPQIFQYDQVNDKFYDFMEVKENEN